LQIEKDLASGHPYARLLYITPESLFNPKFLKSVRLLVQQNELRRLVVDEAHCISEWGSSFRPEYRKLGFFRKEFPDIPIMALTASATAVVERDIIAQLGLSKKHLYRCVEPFNRSNLFMEVSNDCASERNEEVLIGSCEDRFDIDQNRINIG
jgi:superfamily II DNA helicase RecQ